MKSILSFTLTFTFLINSTAFTQNKGKVIEQALPIYNLLKSVKKQDKELFKNLFSKRMVKLLENDPGWDESLKQYTLLFKKEFGEYKKSDFKYKFTPSKSNPQKGQAIIIFKDKELEGLKVIKEGNFWKMDER